MTSRTILSQLSVLLSAFILCACGSIDERQELASPEKVSGTGPGKNELPPSHEELAKKEQVRFENGDYAIRINRTLIYPCRWLRAEDLAATLRPLLETRYGSGVRIVPHAVTNQLLIYIPPLHEQDRVTRRAVPTTRTNRSRSLNSSGGTTVRRAGS